MGARASAAYNSLPSDDPSLFPLVTMDEAMPALLRNKTPNFLVVI
jgi:hypothetical protein